MNVQNLITVVVPTHNGEEFLRENVESILNQTYRNIEIIFVCDRCTDRTIDILQEYAWSDGRLKICTRSKGCGASVARNIGMNMARGEWIIFLDSDDVFELNMLEIMLQQAINEQADMCCCYWEKFFDKINQHVPVKNQAVKRYCKSYPVLSVRNNKKYILQSVPHCPWTKLLHKTIYKKQTVFFQDIANCDDIYFSFVAAMEAKKIVYVDKNLVHYRSNIGRKTLSSNQKLVWVAYDKVYKYICRRKDSFELKQSFYNRVCSCISNAVGCSEYERLFNNLREVYFDRWGMHESNIQKGLSYFNQEICKRLYVCDQTMDYSVIIKQAKRKYICDMAAKGSCSVWGCGNNGRIILENDEHCISVIQHLYDSDKNKWGTYISGKVIEKFGGEWSDCIIVTSPQYYEEIKMCIGDRAGMVVDLEKEIWMY